MSAIRKDFVATHLRSQLKQLHAILESLEEEEGADCEYAYESIRKIELGLRQIRKVCINN